MKKGHFCPLIKKECVGNKCAWYTQVRGVNPNTGHPVDEWQCVVNVLPILLMENSRNSLGTQAAVESFRNESVKQSGALSQVLLHAVSMKGSVPMVEEASIKLLSP